MATDDFELKPKRKYCTRYFADIHALDHEDLCKVVAHLCNKLKVTLYRECSEFSSYLDIEDNDEKEN